MLACIHIKHNKSKVEKHGVCLTDTGLSYISVPV